jgi:antitoxin HicB
MISAYPVVLTPTGEGRLMATFPDVPSAMTEGKGEADTLTWAQDALVVALSGYIDANEDIPNASAVAQGQKLVPLPPLIAAKLAIFQAMRERNVSQVSLAERLECDPKQVRRLLDLDHNSRFDLIDAALRALGKVLFVDVRELATTA